MDCKWSSWGKWSACSKTCGAGAQVRKRTTAIKAKNGGKKCVGSNKATKSCLRRKCAAGTTL